MGEEEASRLPASGQQPRWDSDTEISVLGAMLNDDDARAEALERLDERDFYREGHRRIFAAFRRLDRRGKPGEVVTLADELRSAGELEAAGGMSYLAQLIDAVPSSANLSVHADRLRELRSLREVQRVGERALQRVYEAGPGRGPEVVAETLDQLREIHGRTAPADGGDLRTAAAILEDPDARTRPATVADLLAWRSLVSMLAGREKAGKSTLLRWAAARVSTGRRLWGKEPAPEGPSEVLYWGQERPVDVAADLERMGADPEAVHVRDVRRLDGDRFATLRRDLERVHPALAVVDTLSTFVDRMDLDPGSSSDWEPVMNRFGALAQECEAAVVLNHHARKADGEYRDSTAIGAGVDVILELRRAPSEGERVRRVKAKPRSAVPARDFAYVLTGSEREPRLELLDGSLSLEERVQRFVARHQPCSQIDVREGVRGRDDAIREALEELSRDDGPLDLDDSGTPYSYRVTASPRGTGPEQGRNRPGTAGTDSGGRSCSRNPRAPVGGGGPEQPAGSVDEEPPPGEARGGNSREGEDRAGKTCPTCPLRLAWEDEEDGEPRRVGVTSECCGRCRRHAREVGELWVTA